MKILIKISKLPNNYDFYGKQRGIKIIYANVF